MTSASKQSEICPRMELQPARNADPILDHLEKMIRRTAKLGRTARNQGMGRQYWIDRINAVINEITLLSSQKLRADLLLSELRSYDRG
ncbi:hypothetical protein [Caballeronia sordidicola]|uniref:hypothetical protein n=1 Tax=Caballeronia sordidicola TaxID=196367 RepID=UPI00117E6144|nr:hypothetical protein [Caballeronia sordidicola]